MEEGNLIPVLIKPNLFWMATETAPCHHADQGREGPRYPLVETKQQWLKGMAKAGRFKKKKKSRKRFLGFTRR